MLMAFLLGQKEMSAVRIPDEATKLVKSQGIPIRRAPYGRLLRAGFRLREAIGFADRIASLRVTIKTKVPRLAQTARSLGMTMLLISLLLSVATATTYYVSSSSGNDGNAGTAASAAWATLAHVNAQTFQPGDSILFKRGDVWNESLVPPSSGVSGSPITFDAYGSGPPPNFTRYYAVPKNAWTFVSGNAWKAPVPSSYTTVNFCLFASVWGQKVGAVASNLTASWDFYFANGYIYVYSPAGSPGTVYNEPIVSMGLSNAPVINVNGKSWLVFQHILVNWFDQYGVYVQGASDHLVFANMEADSMIPKGTQPLGFYVNETAPGPGDIKIYNSEVRIHDFGWGVSDDRNLRDASVRRRLHCPGWRELKITSCGYMTLRRPRDTPGMRPCFTLIIRYELLRPF